MAMSPKYKGIESLYEVEDERRAQSTATQAGHDRETGHDSQASPAKINIQALPEARHDLPASPAAQTQLDSPGIDLLASLPAIGGYLKLSNQIVDALLPQLEPYEQILYLHLYRLSHGYGKAFCLISMPKLARRTKISERSLWRAVAELKRKGLVRRGESVHGKGKEQGITFWVAIPAGHDREASPAIQSGHDIVADNKRKVLKESIKKEVAPPDYKNCPDCQGSGFYYPEGIEKGVAKCKHERMGK